MQKNVICNIKSFPCFSLYPDLAAVVAAVVYVAVAVAVAAAAAVAVAAAAAAAPLRS